MPHTHSLAHLPFVVAATLAGVRPEWPRVAGPRSTASAPARDLAV